MARELCWVDNFVTRRLFRSLLQNGICAKCSVFTDSVTYYTIAVDSRCTHSSALAEHRVRTGHAVGWENADMINSCTRVVAVLSPLEPWQIRSHNEDSGLLSNLHNYLISPCSIVYPVLFLFCCTWWPLPPRTPSISVSVLCIIRAAFCHLYIIYTTKEDYYMVAEMFGISFSLSQWYRKR